MAARQFPNLGKPLHGSTGLLLYGLRTFVGVSAAACYQAAGYGRRPLCNGSTTRRGVKGGSVLRREEYVEFGNGRADRGQVRRLIGIRRGVFDAPRQGALGLPKVREREPQDPVGGGFRDRQALGTHGRKCRAG